MYLSKAGKTTEGRKIPTSGFHFDKAIEDCKTDSKNGPNVINNPDTNPGRCT
jgi:hypothetical protein